MRKISDLLSKPLISLNNASFEGTIVGFLCGKKLKSIEYLCVLVENNTLDEIKYLSIKRVKNITNDAVTILNNLCIKKSDTLDTLKYVENPINSNVFTASGILKGKLTDIYFNDLDKYVTEILINDKPLPVGRVASTSKDIIILYNEGQPAVRKSTPRKVKKPQTDLPVNMLDKTKEMQLSFDDSIIDNTFDDNANSINNGETESTVANSVNNGEAENTFDDNVNSIVNDLANNTFDDNANNSVDDLAHCYHNEDITSATTPLEINEIPLPTALEGATISPINDKMPAKLISDYRFLLGRVVTNNIYNVHKVLIIRANTIITADIVEIARKNNKLIELTLSSKS